MDSSSRARRTLRLVLFAIVAISCAYFAQGGGMNQSSRYDLTRAIVEDGTFRIDPYAGNTFDRSSREDHVYSDKAPGLSFAAAPVYAVTRRITAPPEPEHAPGTTELHVVTFLVVGLWSAGAAVLLMELLIALGIGAIAAFVSVLGWTLGTNAFAYGTLFVAHQLVASLLVASFALARFAADAKPERAKAWLALSGLAASWAAISEYPAAPLAVLAFAYGAYTVGIRRMLPFALAALPPLALLAIFDDACFGSPFALGYANVDNEHFREAMSHGLFGVGLPRPTVAWKVLFGEYRGLLPLSPFLLLAIPGARRMWRVRETRVIAIGCLGAFAYGVLLVSSYTVWHGGAAMGPRHLVPMLPFVIVLVASGLEAVLELPSRARRVAIGASGSLVAASIAICTMSVAVMPEFLDVPRPRPPIAELAPLDMDAPFRHFVIPLFMRGHVSEKGVARNGRIGFSSINSGHDDDAFNLGEKLGLHGLWSLAPLLLAWLGLGLLGGRALGALATRPAPDGEANAPRAPVEDAS